MSWNEFLHARQAILSNHKIQRFTQPATLEQPIIADLTQQGLLCFTGEESMLFLQNQLSSDIRLLTEQGCAQYSSYSNPKGRMLASFLIWHHQHYYLQMDAALLPSIQKRLSMYILRAKTQVSDVTSAWGKFGLAGHGIRALLETTFSFPLPKEMGTVICTDGSVIIHLPGERFEWITPIAQAPELWEKLVSAGCIEAGDSVWQLSEIRALSPWITLATQEEFIPQMINLDLIGGISFNKGCYPGQEIVARTHYLGKLKRRLFHAFIATDEAISIGSDVFSPEMQGQSSGKILNAAPVPTGGYEVLVVAQLSSIPHGLHLGSLTGAPLLIKESGQPISE